MFFLLFIFLGLMVTASRNDGCWAENWLQIKKNIWVKRSRTPSNFKMQSMLKTFIVCSHISYRVIGHTTCFDPSTTLSQGWCFSICTDYLQELSCSHYCQTRRLQNVFFVFPQMDAQHRSQEYHYRDAVVFPSCFPFGLWFVSACTAFLLVQ